MKRFIKNVIMVFIIIALIFGSFLTLKKLIESNDNVKIKSDIAEINKENNVLVCKEHRNNKYYSLIFIVNSITISVLLVYIFTSKFNKLLFKETFKNFYSVTNFIFFTLLILISFSYIEILFTNLILTKQGYYIENNNVIVESE